MSNLPYDPDDYLGNEDPLKSKPSTSDLRDALEDMVWQFAHRADNPARLTTGGLSALEYAFEVLGWNDPHLTPEAECDEPGCRRVATCGFPSDSGYRNTCGLHYAYKEPDQCPER